MGASPTRLKYDSLILRACKNCRRHGSGLTCGPAPGSLHVMELAGPADYEHFRQAASADCVAEDDLFAGDPTLIPELDWQSRWFAGEFGNEFTGIDGERIVIRQFGWWNRSAGPDFIETAVEIDGQTHTGAIELDIDARDWERHGHATNPMYEQVAVHLFFRNPTQRFFTRTHTHRKVVQVCLPTSGFEPGRREAPLRLGRCSRPFATMDSDHIERFLLAAARHRATVKARKFLRVAGLHGIDEAWFQATASALGYFANREPMRVLAQRVPIAVLRSRAADSEGLLFGHAGFLDARPFDDATEPDARQYLRRLWESWWKNRTDRVLQPRWEYGGQRPANHPQRRVAALASVVPRWNTLRPMLDAADVQGIRKFFRGLKHPFWSTRFTLAADAREAGVALVGTDRIHDFLGNTVLPVRGQADPSAWSDYAALPGGQASRSVLRAVERLLGARADSARFTRSFALQQGLLQIYQDFCLRDHSACEDCRFPEQLGGWRGY